MSVTTRSGNHSYCPTLAQEIEQLGFSAHEVAPATRIRALLQDNALIGGFGRVAVEEAATEETARFGDGERWGGGSRYVGGDVCRGDDDVLDDGTAEQAIHEL